MPKDGLINDLEYGDTTNRAVSLLIRILRNTPGLSDKLFVTFHHACDTDELDVAEQLLSILESMLRKLLTTNEGSRHRSMEGLVAAFERLWHLRHPER